MSATSGEYWRLRERIARALWKADPPYDGPLPREWGSSSDPLDEDEAYYLRIADAVLADLRLEQVGTVSPDYDGFPRFSGTTPSDEHMNHVRECPVFRLDAPSWATYGVLVATDSGGSGS